MLTPHRDIFCGIFDSNIARKGQMHSNDRRVNCFELEFFHKDSGTSYINGKEHQSRRGMLLCAKPGQIRHSMFPVHCSFIRVFPSPNIDKELIAILSSLPDCVYLDNTAKIEELIALFARLGACFVLPSDSNTDTVLINSLFYEILHRFLRASKNNTDSESSVGMNRISREACNYINENYASSCSLKAIAEAVSISPNHLHTVFSRNIGISPYEYVIIKRIEHAKRLIMTGEMTMIEIALETGFRSQSHFSKIFKEQTGDTPGQFRKKLFSNF